MKDATVVRQLCPFCPVVVDGGIPAPNWLVLTKQKKGPLGQSPPNPACGALPPIQPRVGSKSGNLAPGRPKHLGDDSGQGGSVLYGCIWQRNIVNVLKMVVAGEPVDSSFSANFLK